MDSRSLLPGEAESDCAQTYCSSTRTGWPAPTRRRPPPPRRIRPRRAAGDVPRCGVSRCGAVGAGGPAARLGSTRRARRRDAPPCRASSSACWSTIGPRLVFTNTAVGFIRRGPRHRSAAGAAGQQQVPGPTSAVANNSSRSPAGRRPPRPALRSGSGSTRRRPSRTPADAHHPLRAARPDYAEPCPVEVTAEGSAATAGADEESSRGIAGGWPGSAPVEAAGAAALAPVPQTVMPSSVAAGRRWPGCACRGASRRRFGSPLEQAARELGALPHRDDDVERLEPGGQGVGSATASWNSTTRTGPGTCDQSQKSAATDW